jgi:hypothetical protein
MQTLGIEPSRRGVIFPHSGHESYDLAVQAMDGKASGVGMWRMGSAGKQVFEALAKIPDHAIESKPSIAEILRDRYVEPAYSLGIKAMSESDSVAVEWGTQARASAILLKRALGFKD